MKWQCVIAVGVTLFSSGCVVERTVTDGRGNLIYQEPAVRTPFDSEIQRQAEVEKKEQELGWR